MSLIQRICIIALLCNVGYEVADAQILAKPDKQEIADVVQQLNSDDYQVRESASSKLIELGVHSIKPLVAELESPQSLESRVRAKRILKQISRRIDFATNPESLNVLNELQRSDNLRLRQIADEIIGANPLQMVNELRAAIDHVCQGHQTTVAISDDLFQRLQDSQDFQIVRRPPIRNQDRQSPWRTLQDSEAHQEILLYRIKWFNGKWSGWLMSGVNDMNEKLKRQHWNCFYDHHHEYIELAGAIGDFAKRKDYLPDKRPQEPR